AIRARDPALAVSFWQGDFLSEAEALGHEELRAWIERERAGLRKQLAWAFEQLVGAAQASGDSSGALRVAERWCGALPYDEWAHRRLVESLRLSGHIPEASARHAAFAARLRDELGTEPSADFLRLARTEPAAPIPPRLGARGLLTPDLVGRAEALGRLSAAWSLARQGGSAAVLIEGDEGLGKSRLTREFARLVRLQAGASLVLEGQAFHAERERSWSALRPLLAVLGAAPGLIAAPPAALAVLASIAPEIRERLPRLVEQSETISVADAVLRVLGDVAAETPLLLILDDASASDAASLEVFRTLLRRPPPGTLLVLTSRPESLTGSPLAADLAQSAAHLTRVELTPLEVHDVALLVASMLPLTPETSRPLADRLQRDSSGNPGQVERLVAEWADAGVLAAGPDGRWSITQELGDRALPLPAGIREHVGGLLQRLPRDSRMLAEAASVFEENVEPAQLERTTGVRGQRFASAVGELLSRRILRESRRHPGAYEFTSETTRRAVFDALAPSRRAALQRAAARRRNPAAFRRRIMLGVAATLVLLAGTWLLARANAAAVEPGAQIVLADVDNATRDSALGRAFYSAATIGLQSSHHLSLFPRSRVRETLRRMERTGADSSFTEPLAREVALREGIAMVIALGITQVDTRYLLSARLIDPVSGSDVRAASVTVSGEAGLLSGMDQVLRSARRALGESRRELRIDREPLPRVTTSSLEALRAYVAGGEAWYRRDASGAREQFERAVRLDSTFALALAALADVWYIGNDRVNGDLWMNRALAQLGRLTEREQLRLRGQAASRQGRPGEAVTFTQMLAERYPTRDTWFNLATVLLGQYRCREAIPAIRRALEFDSLYTNAHLNLATCLQLVGTPEASLAAYAAAGRSDSLVLFRGNINHEWGAAFVRAGRPAEAESVYRRMAETGQPNNRARGYRSLAWLELYRGRVRLALPHLTEAIKLLQTGQQGVSIFRNRVILAEAYLALGEMARARAQLDSAAALGKTLELEPALLLYLGHAQLRAGRLGAAKASLERLRAGVIPTNPLHLAHQQGLEGSVLLAGGNGAGAVAATEPQHDERSSAFRLAALAEAYGATQQLDSALAVAVRLSNTFAFGEEAQLEWQRGPLLVARFAEAKGDSATARSAYGRFIEQWKDGDQDLPD
ncbi:MAG TPA: AAA family ATPase, partial [Gemmatimonadales bacterium]|nr:AAA family ATPase [Gemmatimonadales bacterium]